MAFLSGSGSPRHDEPDMSHDAGAFYEQSPSAAAPGVPVAAPPSSPPPGSVAGSNSASFGFVTPPQSFSPPPRIVSPPLHADAYGNPTPPPGVVSSMGMSHSPSYASAGLHPHHQPGPGVSFGSPSSPPPTSHAGHTLQGSRVGSVSGVSAHSGATSPVGGYPINGSPSQLMHGVEQEPGYATGSAGLVRGKTSKSRLSGTTRETGKTGLSVATMSSRKRDKLLPNRWAGAWMIAIFLESAVCIVMAALAFGYIQARVDREVQDLKTMSVYLALLLVGMVFQFLIALDAVRLKNTLQVVGVLVFNIAMCVAAALEIPQVRDALLAQDRAGGGVKCQAADTVSRCDAISSLVPKVRAFLIVVPIVIGVWEFILLSIAWRLWKEFSWSIYTNIGADLKLRNRYLWYQVYVVFLKFTFIFGIFFTAAYLILIADSRYWSYGLTVAAVPVACLILIISAFAARKEEPFLMGGSIILMVAGLVYFVYKLSTIYLPATKDDYRYVRLSLTFISCFAIGALLITIIIAIIVFSNFGKGLKSAHDTIGMFSFVRSQRSAAATSSGGSMFHSKSASRASIDGGAGADPEMQENSTLNGTAHGRAPSRLSLD